MKKLISILFLSILLISFASALEFDNSKSITEISKGGDLVVGDKTLSYNDLWEKYKPVEIKNAFGLGTTLFKGAITEHTEICGSDCQSIIDITHEGGVLIQEIKFIGSQPNSYKIQISNEINLVDVEDFEKSCTSNVITNLNGTKETRYLCEKVKVGTHKEDRVNWIDYKEGSLLEKGDYKVRILGDLGINKVTDWQIKVQGEWIEEWAIWSSVNIVAYYKLDELSGIFANSSTGDFNGTHIGTLELGETGKINTAYNFTSGDAINLTDQFKINDFENGLTYNTWVYRINPGANDYMFYNPDNTSYGDFGIHVISDNSIRVDFPTGDPTTNLLTSSPTLNSGQWYMVTVTHNASKRQLYLNGSLIAENNSVAWVGIPYKPSIGYDGSLSFRGRIDEVGIWNRSLSSTEIETLYNSGIGLPFGIETIAQLEYNGINHTLSCTNGELPTINYPSGTVSFGTTGSTLSVNYTCNSINYIQNITLTTQSNFTLYNSTNTQVITWTYDIFGNNVFYSPFVLEGSLESFVLNIISSVGISSAKLNWNGTDYSSGILSIGGGEFNITNSIEIPDLPVADNVTFFFNITTTTGNYILSDNYNQAVNSSLLDNCSSYSNKLFNLGLYDERLLTSINGTIEANLQVLNSAATTTLSNLSLEFVNASNVSVCSNINLSNSDYLYNLELRYYSFAENESSYDYVPEFYHIQQGSAANLPINISLYDLSANESTEFTLQYRDNNYVDRAGVLLQLNRKYVNEGIYRTVEIPITSEGGVAVVHLDLNNYKYQVIATLNGQVLNIFNNLAVECESELTGLCSISLNGQGSPNSFNNIDTLRGISYSVGQNGTNFTVTYSIPSGETKTVRVSMVQRSPTSTATTLCNSTLTSSSGTFECSALSTIGDSQVDILIYYDDQIVRATGYVQEDLGAFFNLNNYAIGALFIILIITMMVSSPKIMIFAGVFSVVVLGLVFLLRGATVGIIVGAISWLIVVGIIILVKVNKKDES